MWPVAVTQQIARLTRDELASCRSSLRAIDSLCWFKLREPTDYLDLDWAPQPLEQAVAIAALPAGLLEAVRRACSGGSEVNAGYRDAPSTISEHPVTALEPDQVRHVALVLATCTGDDLVRELPPNAADAARLVGMSEFSCHPSEYLRTHYDALRRFYEDAAQQGLATAMWWD
jgi:hypothetical protein